MVSLAPLFGPFPPDAVAVARAIAPLLDRSAALGGANQVLTHARYASGVLAFRVFRPLPQAKHDLFPESDRRPPSEVNALLALQQLGFAPTNAVQTIVNVACYGQDVILGLQTTGYRGRRLQMSFCPAWPQMQAVLAAEPLSHLAWLDADPIVGVIGLLNSTWHLIPAQGAGFPDDSWLRPLAAAMDQTCASLRPEQGRPQHI